MLPTHYLYLSRRKIPEHGALRVPVHAELLDLQLFLPHELLGLWAENWDMRKVCGAALLTAYLLTCSHLTGSLEEFCADTFLMQTPKAKGLSGLEKSSSKRRCTSWIFSYNTEKCWDLYWNDNILNLSNKHDTGRKGYLNILHYPGDHRCSDWVPVWLALLLTLTLNDKDSLLTFFFLLKTGKAVTLHYCFYFHYLPFVL